MAADRKKSGDIYLLCLSRDALREVYLAHLNSATGSDYDLTLCLFGNKPYTFVDEKHVADPAPLHEFGILRTSFDQRMKAFKSLPQELQDVVQEVRYGKHPFGPFVDSKKRYYKLESDSTMTVLIPKGKGTVMEFPNYGDTITITHVHDSGLSMTFIVENIGNSTRNSCLIYYSVDV